MEAIIFDNTTSKAELIAKKTLGNNIEIEDNIKFEKLKNSQTWKKVIKQNQLKRRL